MFFPENNPTRTPKCKRDHLRIFCTDFFSTTRHTLVLIVDYILKLSQFISS